MPADLEYELNTIHWQDFEPLVNEVLQRDAEYDVRPTETTGGDGGVDAFLYDAGEPVGFAHYTKDATKRKFRGDAEDAASRSEPFQHAIFVTTGAPRGRDLDDLRTEFRSEYGWETIEFYTRATLLLLLREQYPRIAERHFEIDPSARRDDLADVQKFVANRRDEILNGDVPVDQFDTDGIVVVHLVPLFSGPTQSTTGRAGEELSRALPYFGRPFMGPGTRKGKYVYATSVRKRAVIMDPGMTVPDYTMLNRDGWYEGVSNQLIGSPTGTPAVDATYLDPEIVETVKGGLNQLEQMTDPYPCYIGVSLHGMEGHVLSGRDRHPPYQNANRFDVDEYIDDTIIEDSDESVTGILRGVLQGIWYAAEWQDGSPHYADGQWQPRMKFIDR